MHIIAEGFLPLPDRFDDSFHERVRARCSSLVELDKSVSAEQPKMKIVTADDEPAVRVLLARQLRRAGFDVTACSNGREALEAIAATGANVVLADWMMPELDGLELCRAVREMSESGALGFVYFILLTAKADDKRHVVEAFDAGADDFLTKPYVEDELLARLRAGVRIIDLQNLVTARQIEVHKINARMAILNRKLQELATTDDLTKLNNRRCMLERLRENWTLAERHQRPMSFIMLDVDHFKRFNDSYGHEAGDVVLVQVAARIKSQLRNADVCGRLGGEEFAVLCPETDLEGAAQVAERIRDAIETHRLTHNGVSLSVTISAGVAQRSQQHPNCDALIAEADRALYAAKNAGRNRVGLSRDGEVEVRTACRQDGVSAES